VRPRADRAAGDAVEGVYRAALVGRGDLSAEAVVDDGDVVGVVLADGYDIAIIALSPETVSWVSG